jgi:hypothetical protein
MFLKVYDRGHTWARGLFLIVTQPATDLPDDPKSFKGCRAFVRQVRMRQCGQFMMGHARIADRPAIEVNSLVLRLSLSGTYGSDGLPNTVPRWIWQHGVQIPEEIAATWATGGGHNSAGSEGPLFRTWAKSNQKALSRAGRTLKPPRYVVTDHPPFWEQYDSTGSFVDKSGEAVFRHYMDIKDYETNTLPIRITFDNKGYGHYVWNHGHELLTNLVAPKPGTQTAGQLCDLLNCQDQPRGE